LHPRIKQGVLKVQKQFTIPVAGQETGVRQYDFKIDASFFEHYPDCGFTDCKAVVNLKVSRQEDLFLLKFSFKGRVGLICDRCLDPFDLEIQGCETVTLKLRKKGQPKDAEEESISAETREVSVRQYVYDFILLKIPFRRVHPEDKNGNSLCNKELLKKIEELSVKKDTDPRWDKLKDLKNN
jgi:uncharacterized protein